MKKFKISDKCNACGLCTAMTDLIVSDEHGFARPAENMFIDGKKAEKIKEIIDICPVRAISEEEVGNTSKQGRDGLTELQKALKNKLEGIDKPKITKDDIKFDAEAYDAEVGDYDNSSRYEYSSDSAAERAALQEFDRGAYSQYRKIILSIFVQYKNDKLKPYYTFDENSFYYKNNQTYVKALKEILTEARNITNNQINLPDSFAEFDVFPGDASDVLNREESVIGLSTFEEKSTQSGIMEEFHSGSYSSLDSYSMYIDTDDMEAYDGTDWRGNSKYKDKYCFLNVYKAVIEFVKDLKRAMKYVQIDETAMYFLDMSLKLYFEAVDSEIKKKIEMFNKAADAVK